MSFVVAYITKEFVIKANQFYTSAFGQNQVVQQEANLDHYLERVQRYAEGIKDGRGKILRKAAFLLFHLAGDAHIFENGNKRTAYISMLRFLSINGLELRYAQVEEYDRAVKLIKETAEGRQTISGIVRWLEKYIVAAQAQAGDED